MKKKVEFEILGEHSLYSESKCDFHPESDYLFIEDGGKEIAWCLECLYKLLKEHKKGQWSVEHGDKKET